MKYIYTGFVSKLDSFREILAREGIKEDETAYMGDDWPDIPVMRLSGLSAAPENALPEVKKEADFVTRQSGGRGAAREVCNLILKAKGFYPEIEKRIALACWDPLPEIEPVIVRAAH